MKTPFLNSSTFLWLLLLPGTVYCYLAWGAAHGAWSDWNLLWTFAAVAIVLAVRWMNRAIDEVHDEVDW